MSTARILLIEDNRENRELMTYLLEAFGHTVFVAETGLDGLDLLCRGLLPDLIVCDVQLPDIGGFEMARLLHEEPITRTIPLVAVTALAMLGDRERILAAGFDGYLPKPIDPQAFVGQIESFLPPRRRTSPPGLPQFERCHAEQREH